MVEYGLYYYLSMMLKVSLCMVVKWSSCPPVYDDIGNVVKMVVHSLNVYQFVIM